MKKATGITRRIDSLGRVVIPMEIRRNNGINAFDLIEIYLNENKEIILKKYDPECVFCNHITEINVYKGKNICKCCIGDISETAFEGG